jgi:acyl-ACP thioesterase
MPMTGNPAPNITIKFQTKSVQNTNNIYYPQKTNINYQPPCSGGQPQMEITQHVHPSQQKQTQNLSQQ